MLKERRRLVLMPRETPLSLIHLENMAAVTRAGAIVLPAMPGFYNLPRTMDDLVDFMVAKALDLMGVPHELLARWGEPVRQAGRMSVGAPGRLPATEVRAMFDRIAPRYDLLNRAMTAGLDGRWRQAAAAAADLAAGDRALDCCTGTGDLALALADRVTPSGRVAAVDFSERMVALAREKAARRGRTIDVQVADALALPFPGDTFDAATVAFGIRNVADLDAGLAEMARVVRPGGRVVILEITAPARLRRFYGFWFDRVVPRLGPAARSRRGRLLVPAGLGAALPRAAGAGRPDGGGGPGRRAVAPAGGRDRRPPPRPGRSMTTTPVPAVALPLAPLLARCEERLRQAVSRARAEVVEPALDTLTAGGKRVRPLLVFCSAPARGAHRPGRHRGPAVGGGGRGAGAQRDAGARRPAGRRDHAPGPAHRGPGAGPERAVTTGDFLFACAFAELTRTRSAPAVQALAAAALDLSRGEMDQQRAAFDLALHEEAYLARCRRKTAALFSVACRLGALVGGGGREAEERLAAFGENVGMAFQIFDDILDLAGAPAATGKRRGTDLCDGTVTLPVILALRLEPALRPRVAEACQGPGLEGLCDRLAAHPGVDLARERALEFVAAARRAVEVEGPAGGADVAALREIADGVVDRYS